MVNRANKTIILRLDNEGSFAIWVNAISQNKVDFQKMSGKVSRMELSGRYSGITRTAVRDYSDDSLALSGISSGIIRTA